jgi:FkbM family methyltransferase
VTDPPRAPEFVNAFDWRLSRAQLFQDLWVLSETGSQRNGFFVEIGAFDGVALSNSYLLEKGYGWRGLLVEPNPRYAGAIRATRSASLDVRPVHGASGERVDMFFVRDAPELSAMEDFAFNDSHATEREIHDTVTQTTVSLNDLLLEYHAPRTIDFMSIDTEGNEVAILTTFDFDRYDIRFMCIEHNHTTAEQTLDEIMSRHRYERVHAAWSRWDAWYRKV